MDTIPDVIKNCSEFINILRLGEKGCFLTRMIHDNSIDIKYCNRPFLIRSPKNMHISIHNALNTHFQKTFGWPVRNGVFSFGVKGNFNSLSELGYGTSYLLFPCGDFKYVYDDNIFDLFGTYIEFFKLEPDSTIHDFISTINYLDRDLNSAMSKVLHEDRSAEIMINCKNYYLINLSYINELTNLIWD